MMIQVELTKTWTETVFPCVPDTVSQLCSSC